MRTSYGVVWEEDGHPRATGRLEMAASGLRLEGIGDSEAILREVPYDDLAAVRIGRAAAERLDGRPVLVLELRSGVKVRIAAVAQSIVLSEMAERIAALSFGPVQRRFAVVLPINEGSHNAVQELLEAGPPFDPERTALDRHDVFLTRSEVVFVFEARAGATAVEELLREPELWKQAVEWRAHLAGPPHIAEDVYSWTRERGDHGARRARGNDILTRAHDRNSDR